MNNISCPKCSWTPKSDDIWFCTCGTLWNTFDTAGRCPTCHHQWEFTQCHSDVGCGEWSPHLDWYPKLDERLESELESTIVELDKHLESN